MTPRPCRTSAALPSAALFFLAVICVSAVSAEPLASIPNPRVRNGTWVADMPGALRADTVARLNQTIASTEKSHGIEMAVVVVQWLDGLTVDEAAVKLFDLWRIGKKGRDNGLLFLWSRGDRQLRVEVGYGLESVLPDGTVGAILDAYVVPNFKAGEFDAGIIAGVDALLATARRESVALPAMSGTSYEADGWLPAWWPLLGGVPIGVGALTIVRRWRRYRRRRCPQCQARMALMPDYEDDAVLQDGQVAEERIGSVEYDVWKCAACSHHFTLRYAKWISKYDTCPQCSNRTKSSTQSTIHAATKHSEGSALVLETCAFCTFTNEFTRVLPRIPESSSSSSGGSSGGSSFGGGRSGGGGASRGY